MKNHIQRDHLGTKTVSSSAVLTSVAKTAVTPDSVSLSYPCSKCQVHFFTYEDLMVHSWRVHNTVPQQHVHLVKAPDNTAQSAKASEGGKLTYDCQLCDESFYMVQVK